jgi:hypothetical protein
MEINLYKSTIPRLFTATPQIINKYDVKKSFYNKIKKSDITALYI